MANPFEKTKTPAEMAEIQKNRAISDAELLTKGAGYKADKEGDVRLEATEEQIDVARSEMKSDLASKDNNEETFALSLTGQEKELFAYYNEVMESHRQIEPILAKLPDAEKGIITKEWAKPYEEKSKSLIQNVPDGERRREIHKKAIEFFQKKNGTAEQEQENDAIKKEGNIKTSEQLTPENIKSATENGKPLEVRVQRSSGTFEEDWMVTNYDLNDGLARVIKFEGDGRIIQKFIPLTELIQWQKEFSPEELEKELQKVESFEDLTKLLEKNGNVQGSQEFFEGKKLIELIGKVRKGELNSTAITRIGGLRQKVVDLMAMEKHRDIIFNK